MHKKKRSKVVLSSKFEHESELQLGSHTITKGDVIKVQGEYGLRFKFDSLTTNTETGAQWVDCFELHKGIAFRFRSFDIDKIKRVPKKRVKHVN